MDKLGCAIIGCGAISKTHIDTICGNSNAELLAVCDIIPERAKDVSDSRSEKNIACFTDYKEMLTELKEKIDVVHICTPHHLHAEMAIYAVENGFNVYLEKPCAISTEQAMKIVEASSKSGKKVCVSFQNRVASTTVAAKEIINSGRLGKFIGMRGIVSWDRGEKYYKESEWRGKKESAGGGILINQAIHTLDMLYYFGGEVEKVEGSVALRKNKGIIEVEDTAEATIWFKNGLSAVFWATNCNVTSIPAELELICEKGSLLMSNNRLYERTKDGLFEACRSDNTKVEKAVWGAGHAEMIDRFYRAVLGEDVWYCDIADSYQVLEIIEKIYETSANKL